MYFRNNDHNVTMSDLQTSNEDVDFGNVKCGQCRIVTSQFDNHKEVTSESSASYLPDKVSFASSLT